MNIFARLSAHNLLFALLAISTYALPTYAQDQDFDQEPDSVSSYQKFSFDDPDRTTFEFIHVYSDSPEGALEGYEKTLREHAPAAKPYENFDFGALFEGENELRDAEEKLNLRVKLPEDRKVLLNWKSLQSQTRAHSLPQRSPSRKPASDGIDKPLSRKELLEHWHYLKSSKTGIDWTKNRNIILPSGESLQRSFAAHGEEIIDLAFKKSRNRVAFIIIRGSLGGVGAYVGAVMSNMDPEITAFMTVLGAAISTTIQSQIGRLGNFLTKSGKAEVAIYNLILRPSTLFKKKIAQTMVGKKSSWFAFMSKWYVTEYVVNQVNRLGGLFAYEKLFPDSKIYQNGVAQVPDAFKLGQGFHDSVELGLDTLFTQGVYEQVFMTEFNRRTLPYHELMGYYTELLETTTDEALQTQYRRIIQSCLKRGVKERVIRSGLATVGSMSWIMALAFKGHAESLSKICSYSLLPVAGSLKTYYYFREKAENAFLNNLDSTPSKKLKSSLTATIRDYCSMRVKEVKEWAKDFQGDIVNVIPKKVTP